MRLSIKKWRVFIFVASVLFVLSIYLIDRERRCKTNGLSRDEALEVANWKLGIQFRNSPLLHQFKLTSDQFESDKSWIFTYHAEGCVTYIIIDKCGVADVGGLSKGCISR